MDAWADATARHLVAADNLGLISVWHPSFFVLLLRRIEASLDALLDDVPARRRAAVRRRLQTRHAGRSALAAPGASSRAGRMEPRQDAVPALHRYVPHARIQPKGLLATEGVVSFPLQLENVSDRTVESLPPSPVTFSSSSISNALPLLRVLAHELRPGRCLRPGHLHRRRLLSLQARRCRSLHRVSSAGAPAPVRGPDRSGLGSAAARSSTRGWWPRHSATPRKRRARRSPLRCSRRQPVIRPVTASTPKARTRRRCSASAMRSSARCVTATATGTRARSAS